MKDFYDQAIQWLTGPQVFSMIRASLLILFGLLIARLISKGVRSLLDTKLDTHGLMLATRVSYYLILGLFLISAMRELGFSLNVLLGAAGILTVAIGFASQTSASNLISGMFLLVERPFRIGDIIKVGTTTGEVLTIDLLSVKLRTFDNLFVRIPNETLIKTEITTLTRFPIRRFDLLMGVAYKEDIEHVKKVLFDVAENNPLCLEEPKPLFIHQGFGDSSVNFQFSIWAKRENFLELKNSIQIEIKKAFDDAGIEIPFPHRTLYTGAQTDPFPVQLSKTETNTEFTQE
ncbi:MAG: mechanosensitive ion channel family protein [Gammaproteobacteria bacterium]|nr:mechanosensitive ion channel family protein [Gammaproteobacteria bacterium]